MHDTAGEAGTSSLVMFSYGPPHMAEQKQGDQLEPTYNRSVRIQDVALRTWTRHAGHCWRSRDELISDVLLWTSSHGRAKAGWPARTYIQQLCEDTGCSPGDLNQTCRTLLEKQGRAHVLFSDGPPHMAEQKQGDQLEPTSTALWGLVIIIIIIIAVVYLFVLFILFIIY